MKTSLQQETEAYWLISSTWNSRISHELRTQDALQRLGSALSRIGTRRALYKHLDSLQMDIINPRMSKRNKTLAPPIPMKRVEVVNESVSVSASQNG